MAGNGIAPYTYTWTGGVSTTASCTKLLAGNYTVTIKDNHGCPANNITFSVTQPPAIRDSSILADKVNVSCNGGNDASITLGTKYGNPPYTYAWSPNVSGSGVANNLTAGVYTITVMDNIGCSSSATATITQPAAALSATFGATNCPTTLVTVTLTATGGTVPYTYAWSPGGGTKATMSNLTPGTYTVTVRDRNGCSFTTSSDLTCPPEVLRRSKESEVNTSNCCQGLEDITLYPNPNSGQFTLTGLQQGMSIEMYDYTGRKLSSQLTIHDSQLVINISDQPNGIYLIRIVDKEGNLVSQKKVVKTN
jgi:hypothetical protein